MEPPSPGNPASTAEPESPTQDGTAVPRHPRSYQTGGSLSILVVCALALRLWGITWSLPNQEHLFSYHPDEGVNLINGVLDTDGTPRPHLDLRFYNYGSLYFYLWQSASAINRAYGFISLPSSGSPQRPDPESIASVILVGRLVSSLLGALTLIPIFFLGSRLFGSRAAWIGTPIYGTIPVAVIHAHFATVDVSATFFIAVALAVGARLLTSPNLGNIVFVGICCGLAAATKYNCMLVIFAPAVALMAGPVAIGKQKLINFALLALSACLGFVIGCPGILLNWSGFWHDFSYELHKSGEGMGLLFADTGNGWVYHLTSSLRFGLGIPLLLLSLAAIGCALVRRTRQDWYLLAFVIPYYLVIGYAQVRFMRYVIPMMPVLAVLVGRMVVEAMQSKRMLGRVVVTTSGAILAITLLYGLAIDHVMATPDSRDQAKAALDSVAPLGAQVAFARLPWYDVPPLAPEFTAASPASRRAAAYELRRFTCILPPADVELDAAVLTGAASPPQYAVLSDIATEDWERLKIAGWLEFKRILESRYTRRDFQNEPSIFGINFGKPDYVPNDLLYIYPRISIYTRK